MKRVVLGAVVAVAYAWWAAGVAPFSTLAYLSIALPATAGLVLLVTAGRVAVRPHERAQREGRPREWAQREGRPATTVSLASCAPWVIVLVLAVALEAWGLALGGRSAAVPTLSTTVDHLLATRVERTVLYVAWLALGAAPLARHRRRRSEHS